MDVADYALTEPPRMREPIVTVLANPRRPRRLTAAAALRSVPDGVIVFGARMRVRICNHLAASILRLDGGTRAVGSTLPQLLEASGRLDDAGRAVLVDAATFAQRDGASAVTLMLRDGGTVFADIRRIDDGAWCLVLTVPRPALIDGSGAQAFSAHDPLTGLADRALFRERVSEALDRGGECAVLIIDLDRFQAVNDTHGHAAGDMLLQAVADRLRSALRSDDLIARMSADEFAMLLPREAMTETARLVARRLVDLIGRPYVVKGVLINIAASIGVAISPSDGDAADELMRNAGFALRQAKAGGRNTWRAFDPEIGARARDRLALAADLRRALEAGQFILNYQPQITLIGRRLVGFEALVRWRHPQRGLIPPDHFIPLAEETGLIEKLGEWVMRTACTEAMRWPAPLTVAVNVSAVQFVQAHNLVRAVRRTLAESGLPGPRLDIEITESVLLNAASTHDTLAALRALGVRISMDDFGTGYSSLGQLRSFPFDKIKIDRCFVRDIETSAESAAVIRAISVLGPSLGMSTTVEGVETEAQAALVAGLGCTDMQGFLVSRPVPAEAVPALIGLWGASAA